MPGHEGSGCFSVATSDADGFSPIVAAGELNFGYDRYSLLLKLQDQWGGIRYPWTLDHIACLHDPVNGVLTLFKLELVILKGISVAGADLAKVGDKNWQSLLSGKDCGPDTTLGCSKYDYVLFQINEF